MMIRNNSISLLINHLLPLPCIWARLVGEIHKKGGGGGGGGGGGVGVGREDEGGGRADMDVAMDVAMATLMKPTPSVYTCPGPFLKMLCNCGCCRGWQCRPLWKTL